MIPAQPVVKFIGAASGPYGLVQPFHAFTDAASAAWWAWQCNEDDEEPERYVWPVEAVQLGDPLLGAKIPARYELAPAIVDAEIIEEGQEP